MRRLLLTAILFASCGPLVTEPMPDIPETVEHETVRLEYGENENRETEGALEKREQALVGDSSFTALLSAGVVLQTNYLTILPFVIIDLLKQYPPTEFTENSWAWESRNDQDGETPFRLELVETAAATVDTNGSYDFRLFSAETATSEFLLTADGSYTLFARDEIDRQQAMGRVNYDFTAMRQVDKKTDEPTGRMQIGFRSNGNVRQVNVVFLDFDDPKEGNGPENFHIRYRRNFKTEIGEMTYSQKTDFLKDGEPFERFAVHGAWNNDRIGRSLTRVDGGSLEINELLLEECWERAKITFADLTPDVDFPYEDGERDACDETLLGLQLEPPEDNTPAEVSIPSVDLEE